MIRPLISIGAKFFTSRIAAKIDSVISNKKGNAKKNLYNPSTI